MRYLLVNADDWGASPGINRGILDAHRLGIVTSTSLMVDTPWSDGAAWLSLSAPRLSVGLHVVLPAPAGAAGPANGDGANRFRDELARQYGRFRKLLGRRPTHVDSHRNVHRDPGLLAVFLEFSRLWGLPLRGHSPVRYFPNFYGQWSGESHPEHVGFESLVRMLETEMQEGTTELSCHPGYPDPQLASAYAFEREVELRTLCDPRIRAVLQDQGITLESYHDLGRLSPIHSKR